MGAEDSPAVAEIDRQLIDQRAHADSVSSRAGLLVATAAIAATLIGGRLQDPSFELSLWVVVLAAAAVLSGVAVLTMAHLTRGPSLAALVRTGPDLQEAQAAELWRAKVQAVEANRDQLVRVDFMFRAQALATAGSGLSILLQLGGTIT